jgi:hypothetical protein
MPQKGSAVVTSVKAGYCGARSDTTPVPLRRSARTLTPIQPSRFRRRTTRAAVILAAWGLLAGAASMALPNVPLKPSQVRVSEGYAVGAVHMHTRRSDGSGTIDDLVEAAVSHDLDFIVVSDHNTEEPTRYEYRRGVLVVLGEELTTLRGHVMMLQVDSVRVSEPDSTDRAHGLPFHRTLGDAGLTFVSHPNGRRYWRDRTMHDVDGMEIWNADSEWRNDGVLDWIEALTLLPFRPELGMMALVDRPDRNLALLDSVTSLRDIATTCAVDAHARIPITDDLLIPFPSYRMTLGLVQHHLRLVQPLTGDAERDGVTVTESLRRGEGYCAMGGLADDRDVQIRVDDGELRVEIPGELERARIRVYRDGSVVAEQEGSEARIPLADRGVYRVEVGPCSVRSRTTTATGTRFRRRSGKKVPTQATG